MVLFTPCTWLVVQWWRGPSKQGSFTPVKGLPLQTKGTTGDHVGHALWPSLLDKATLRPF